MGGFKRQLTNSFDPASPTTLGDLAAEGLQVFCWCHRCGHNAEIGQRRRLPAPMVCSRTWRQNAVYILRKLTSPPSRLYAWWPDCPPCLRGMDRLPGWVMAA